MSVFSFLNPFLLWGLVAVSAPIIIHLLLRQKPRPRPWAAMRWLQAALHAAQRRYKITNLLLLLMRCAIIALLALAVSRPHWGLWSEGGDLVILVDVSASMANDQNGDGPLQSLKNQLREKPFTQDRVCLITVGHQTNVVSDGDAQDALRSLQQIESDYLPGGLNRALDDGSLTLITSKLRSHSTLLCVSDFRQDDGTAIIKTLENSVFQISRWQVGSQQNNAYVHDIPTLPDFVASQAQQFQIILNGQTEEIAQLRINNGSASPLSVQDPMQISVPPLPAGRHDLQISFKDKGLAYDNNLHLAIDVRAAVPCLVVQQQFGYLAAVIDAAHEQLDYRAVDPARLHTEPLPAHGLVLIDAVVGNMDRVLKWTEQGGVVFVWSDILEQHKGFQERCGGLSIQDMPRSGKIISDNAIISRTFSAFDFDNITCLQVGEQCEALLHLDDHVIAARCPIGDGYAIIVSKDLRGNDQFWAQGGAPFWLRDNLRQSTSLAQQPNILHSGEILSEDITLVYEDGAEFTFQKEQPLLMKPGLATEKTSQRSIIILPNQEESILALPVHDQVARNLEGAIPSQLGSDWSLWVLIALCVLCLFECLFAGHAGRTYGQ